MTLYEMTLCEKCIHSEVCNIRDCHEEGDERALVQCSKFRNKADVPEIKHARWKGAGLGEYYCSLCCEVGDVREKICPHCKAVMYTDEEYNQRLVEWEIEDGVNAFEDFVKVVRCKDCQYAEELDKHCEINRSAYKHCILLRGDETRNVWHKYAKYYKDYSLVESEDFCSAGIRRETK